MPRLLRSLLAGLALVVLAGALAAPPAHAQDTPGKGVEVKALGAFTALGGRVFQFGDTGLGGAVMARHWWPTGLAVGAGARWTFPSVTLPDNTENDFSVFEGFATAAYSPVATGPVRPFVELRGGYLGVERDVTLPPDAPIFGPRAPEQIPATGGGFLYGGSVGTEIWVSDRAAIRVAGTGALFDAGEDFQVGEGGADLDTGSEIIGIELGVSAFLGGWVDSDGDGVRDGNDDCPGTPRTVVVVTEDGCALDSDEDGVPDYRDQCSGTSSDLAVDERGCAADADADGVFDGRDECDDTPRGAVVNAQGCAVDQDEDGVPDGLDRCNDTPEGAPVTEDGCVADGDADGVYDPSDECPGTREGAEVDDAGCTEIQRGLAEGRLVLQDVQFRQGSASPAPGALEVMARVGRAIVQQRARVEVRVHTSAAGAADRNRELSQRRAETLVRYLRDLYPELGGDRVSGRGMGEGEPLAPGDAERNERVEVVVTGEAQPDEDGDGGDGGEGGGARR